MKKIYAFLLLNALAVITFSQGVNYQYGQFRLGINTGTTFQSADIRTQIGLGWGLLAEYDFMKSKYSAIGFSLRGRYLRANMYGNHAKYFTDYPLSNDAINGSANDTIDYTGKPLFLNNKTRAWEYSLEAQFHTHSLYQDYGIGFHLFVGAGLTNFEVYTNQLDNNNTMYDYSQIDYSLSEKQRIKDLRQLRYYSYETKVTANNMPSIVFTPTIGAGVQFRLSPYWSLMLEHKISLPQTDLFDGQTYTVDKDPSFVQDVYHYSSFGLIWYIGTRSDEQILHQETSYTQATGNTTTQNTQQTTTTTYTQTTPKPQIIIVKQDVTPLPQGCSSVIEAQIKNINNKSDIKFYHNNVLVSENQYSFTLPDKFIAHVQLSDGNNIFKITATNQQNVSIEKTFNLTCTNPTITICHKNPNGIKQTLVIKENEWAAHQAHGDYKGTCRNVDTQSIPEKKITICHTDRETGKKTTISINAKDWPVHQAHGDSKGSCQRTTPAPKKITICHYNKEKDQLEQLQIPPSEWPAHQAHGDVKGSCSQVDQTPIKICHVVNSKVKITKVIPAYQWPYHQAHGDVQGECQNDPVIIICHKNSNGTHQTMNIHQSEWAAHQAHGDTQGACSTGSSSGGIGGNKMTICHTDPQTGQKSTIQINIQDWFTHQAHGDSQGACPNNSKQTKQVKIKKQSITKP